MNAPEQEDRFVTSALSKVGVQVNSVYDLVNSQRSYPEAIATLLHCLTQVSEPVIQEGVVRALAVREARGIAENALLAEFEKIRPEEAPNRQLLKWAIANTLAVVATGKSFDRITNLVRDRRHGSAREMLTVALGNMKLPNVVDVLIDLLSDDEIAGDALMVLAKLRAHKARPHIKPLLNHPSPWIRKEVRKALSKL